MAIKSKWAYNNGKRVMAECLAQNKPAEWEFVNNKYAEKGNIKTYSNKTQCMAKIEKLKAEGVNVEMSASWPYLLLNVQ